MRIAFISLMEGFRWGGSEELWSKVVLHSLHQEEKVFVSTKFWDGAPPKKIEQLGSQGAMLHQWKALPAKTILQRILIKLRVQRAPKRTFNWQDVALFEPHELCISMGGTFDLLYHPELIDLIGLKQYSYSLICQLNFENSPLIDEARNLARVLFKNAKNIFFVSERNKVVAERNLAISLPNASVVSNPVNLDQLIPLPYVLSDCIHFACVARLDSKFKGQDILLEIFSTEEWKGRNWNLNFYGEGPDKNYLLELVDFYGLSGRVFFHGHIHDVKTIWSNNHLQLMPSFAEGTPLALIEAMFCGRPAIVTDVGGNAELIEEGITGFIADAYGKIPFAKALEKAWDNRDSFKQLGRNANKLVNEKIKLQSHVEIYKKIIK